MTTSVISGSFSAYQQLEASENIAESYNKKSQRAKTAGERALLNARINSTRLQESYNETQANQMLVSSFQMRSGQTVSNIARNDAENLEWDKEFLRLNGVIEEAGARMDAAENKIAASQTIKSGYESAAMGMLNVGTSIGGLT